MSGQMEPVWDAGKRVAKVDGEARQGEREVEKYEEPGKGGWRGRRKQGVGRREDDGRHNSANSQESGARRGDERNQQDRRRRRADRKEEWGG